MRELGSENVFVKKGCCTRGRGALVCCLRFFELSRGLDEVDVAEEHGATAASFEAEVVHDFFACFALFNAFFVFVVEVRDWFSTAEAPYRDYHALTVALLSFAARASLSVGFARFFLSDVCDEELSVVVHEYVFEFRFCFCERFCDDESRCTCLPVDSASIDFDCDVYIFCLFSCNEEGFFDFELVRVRGEVFDTFSIDCDVTASFFEGCACRSSFSFSACVNGFHCFPPSSLLISFNVMYWASVLLMCASSMVSP